MGIYGFHLKLSPVKRYSLAICIFIVAFSFRFLLIPVESGLTFITFYPATVIGFYLCGKRPGALIAILSAIAGYYFFMPHVMKTVFQPDGFIAVTIFLGSAFLISRIIKQQQLLLFQLKETNQRYLGILEDQTEIICRYKADGTILYVNDAFCRMFNRPRGALVGQTWHPVVWSEDIPLIKEKLSMLSPTNPVVTIENRIITPGRGIRWGQFVNRAFFDEAGQLIEMQAVGRDITERKILENKLKASEAKFRSIIEVSPIPMALNDEQMNITYLNPAFVQTFGYNLTDIPVLSVWWKYAYPDIDYRHWVQTTWRASLENAKRQNADFLPLELVIRCKDNHIKTVLVSAASIQNDFSGEHLVILYDITQRKQLDAKLNAIFNAALEGIITVDSCCKVVSVNTAVDSIFGYEPDELIGFDIGKLMPLLHNVMRNCCWPSPETCDCPIMEIEGIHKNGSVIPLDISIAKYSIDNAYFLTVIVRDVSIRKQREQRDKEHLVQLAHVTRLGLMGEMASGIAHEVNQPLNAISSYTEAIVNLIKSERPDLPKLTEILYKTQQQALRAGQIIHRMKGFVKSYSQHRSSTDINVLIHDAVSLCIAELKDNNIQLTCELEKNLPTILIDKIQIEQVLINLIRNGIDALHDLSATRQRHLTIVSRLVVNDGIQVRVNDNGIGIDSAQQKQIWMPFYTTKPKGMGMGLSISRSLIENHRGSLQFDSIPGEGSNFYFTLPRRLISDEPYDEEKPLIY